MATHPRQLSTPRSSALLAIIAVGLLVSPTPAHADDITGSVHELGTDKPLGGFVVSVKGASGVEPAAVTDEGNFIITDAPSGDAVLEVRSATGALFGEFPAAAGRALINVEPSGHIYASDSGAAAAGVTVRLRQAQGGAVVTSQITDAHGLYRLELPGAGSYSIDVITDGQSYHFPSVRIPPQDGLAVFDAVTGAVDAGPTPDPSAPRAYWLAFEAKADTAVAPRHNHIPVDRGGALVAIEKTASKSQAGVGDIITYTVRVENRSGRDFDRVGGRGGVILRDVLPGATRLVAGSARAAIDGIAVTLAEQTNPQILEFRLADPSGAKNFELKAGQRIFLRYQVVVGVNAREGMTLTNRAQVVEPGGVGLSDVARVDVRVVGDPLFERSWVRGRVYCDEDGDEWAGARDPGVFGARVYIDTGRYAITDRDGKFHLSDVPPGLHLIKVDPDTVPPDSEPVTEISRNVHVSRGIPVQLSFGFRCSTAATGPSAVIPAEKDQPLPPLERLVVTGSVKDLSVSVEGAVVGGSGAAGLAVVGAPEDKPLDLHWGPRGLVQPLTLKLAAPAAAAPPAEGSAPAPPTATWRVWIELEDAQNRWQPLRAFGGTGPPPEQLQWNGTNATGRIVVAGRGGLHRARLEVTDGQGTRWTSPAAHFTVSHGAREAVEKVALPERIFDRRGRATRAARRLFERLGRTMKGLTGARAVVVMQVVGAVDMQPHFDAAERIAQQVVKAAGVPPAAVGVRVVAGPTAGTMVYLFDAGVRPGVRPPTPPKPSPISVRVNGVEASANEEGRFVLAPARPSDGLLVIEMVAESGARRETVARPGAAGTAGGQLVRAALERGELEVAGSMVDLRPMEVRTRLPYQRLGLLLTIPEVGIEFEVTSPQEDIASWKLVVTGPLGEEVWAASGEGAPPARVNWDDAADLQAGDYLYGIQVTTTRGSVGYSPRRVLALGEELTGGAPGMVIETLRGGRLFTRDDRLRRGFQRRLVALAATLGQRSADERLLVEVHSAGSGEESTSRVQTSVRAQRIRNFLVMKGVPEGRIAYVGLGNLRPVASPDDAAGRRQNERIEIRVLPPEGDGPAQRSWGLEVGGRDVLINQRGAALSRLDAEPGATLEVIALGRYGQRVVASVQVPPEEEHPEEAAPPAPPFGIPTLSRALQHQRQGLGPPPPLAVADLSVELPPDGSKLGQPLLPIKGTVPVGRGIRVTINGQHVPVHDGGFELLFPLPNGEISSVVIEARDSDGNVARIERKYEVKGHALFLMALLDGALSQHGTKLDQRTDTLDVGPVLLHGRGALYLKARIKGGDLIKLVRITGFVDTARDPEFTNFADQVIDPDRHYPIYGDASTEVNDARTRGRYFVAVEADASKLILGTFRTSAWGVELLRYDRVMEGVQIRLDQAWVPGYQTVVEGFVNYADTRVRRSHATLGGTGGSYYFLPDREIVEGSDQVLLAIYDRDTGARIQTVPQVRDVDYRVDYLSGRLEFKKPIPSRVDASFLAGASDILSGRLAMEGHEVRVQVDYETRTPRDIGDVTWGLNGSQTFADMVTVGGGYVREGRGEGQGPDYELYGAEVRVTPAERTRVEAEVGRSTSSNGANWLSRDGGLSYDAVGSEPADVKDGWGVTVRAETDIGEFLGKTDPWLILRANYQRQDKGFVSSHTVLEQGHERGGAELRWHIDRNMRLTVRHDTLQTLQDDSTVEDGDRAVDRSITTAQYSHRVGDWTLVGEVLHSYETDEADDEGTNRGAISLLARYRVHPRVALFAEQQFFLGGESPVFRSKGDHVVTGFGLDVDLGGDISLTLGERIRWSGEDSTVLGLRTRLSDTATLYAEQRLIHPRDTHRWVPATVVGSEERWGPGGSGRSYGEYQVGSSQSGPFNRAVLGLGRRFRVLPGLNADFSFERSHTNVVDGVGQDRDTNTFSIGGEYVGHRSFNVSTRLEARFENSDFERIQLVSFNRVSAELGKGFSLFGRADFGITQNKDLDQREAETVNLMLGLAYRPLDDTLTLLLKAAHIIDMRPVNLDPRGGFLRTSATIVAIEPIIELPLRLQVTPKFAWRRAVEDAEGTGGEVTSNTLLAALRVALHLVQMVDIAAEYRWINVDLLDQMEHGVLTELSVTISRYARIGVGYNFTSFNDDLFDVVPRGSGTTLADPLSRNDHGFFVRVAGMY